MRQKIRASHPSLTGLIDLIFSWCKKANSEVLSLRMKNERVGIKNTKSKNNSWELDQHAKPLLKVC